MELQQCAQDGATNDPCSVEYAKRDGESCKAKRRFEPQDAHTKSRGLEAGRNRVDKRRKMVNGAICIIFWEVKAAKLALKVAHRRSRGEPQRSCDLTLQVERG